MLLPLAIRDISILRSLGHCVHEERDEQHDEEKELIEQRHLIRRLIASQRRDTSLKISAFAISRTAQASISSVLE